MEYEAVIGLEVHSQLLTRSKMFCSCAADYQSSEPNSRVCPVCLGMPGVLPVINKKAVEYTVMTALALNCQIASESKFDRKNYPYPDLMKGYQISQYDMPLSHDGWLEIEMDGQTRRIGIIRVHLEEDVAKLFHRRDLSGETYSLMDVNRSGVPLMEIVGAPDIRTPEEARLYLMKLRTILQYIGVSTGNMEEGSFRCDANVSIRPKGSSGLGAKVEVKNMNSFRAVQRAMQYELERQVKVVESGGRIPQETRGWVEEKGITVSQRSKEFAHDYRYFPEPDLPPMQISPQWVEEIRARLPELPDARRERFVSSYGLSLYDASLLTASKTYADFFEEALKLERPRKMSLQARAKALANWVLGEMARLLNDAGLEPEKLPIAPTALVELLELVDANTISVSMAKTVFQETFKTGRSPAEIVRSSAMAQISDAERLRSVVEEVLRNNAQAVADYLGGKETALRFLVGQVMKATKGQASPGLTNELLREALSKQRE